MRTDGVMMHVHGSSRVQSLREAYLPVSAEAVNRTVGSVVSQNRKHGRGVKTVWRTTEGMADRQRNRTARIQRREC